MKVTAALGLWLVVTPILVRAQAPDSAIVHRADSITVGDYCRLAQRIVADPGVIAKLGPDAGVARSQAEVICAPQFSSHSLLAVSGGKPASVGTVARLDTNVARRVQVNVVQAMRLFSTLTTDTLIEPAITAALGETETRNFFRVTGTERQLRLRGTRDAALDRLARYERKLGPTAPKLNGPEVLLNYLAQRFVRGFRPTPLGGPSPWEVVASYSPGYVTLAEGTSEPVPVSTSEFGLRFYLFGENFGTGLLRPSYLSFGVLTASDRNGALVWPWRGRDRSGLFLSWGTIKLGYINRENGTFLFSRQFQAVPFVF